jgi:ABC-type transport system involved in multi-copper enzyme maturation permease subunit
MLKTIIKKEIQNNIFSFRFLTSFVLLLVIVPVTVFILTNDYLRRIDEYSLRQTEIENYMKNYAHFNRVQNVIRPTQPPLPFYSLIRGISQDVNIEEFDDDPLPVMFPLIDLVFIVTILMSLIALIFSYDSVSGEKEDGTLKLILSNDIPRSKVILGKIMGGILTLFIPFLFSLVVGLLIVALHPRVSWKGADWGALGLIVVGSALYFGFFYGLGVFISSRHHSSSSSIMTSLFAWVLLVLVVPNLSPYVASFISPASSRIKIARETSRITDTERDDLGNKLVKERLGELVKKYPVLAENLSEAETKKRVAKDPAYREAYQARTHEVQAAWDEANRIQNEKADRIWREVSRKEAAQTDLSRYLSMVSPFSDFTYLATDLSSTGIRNEAHFGQVSDLFWQAYADYSRQKIEALQKKDPSTDWWNTAVDMSDRPRFRYQQEALSGRVQATLPAFAVLIICGLILFLAAYFSFIRYDVR